MRSTFRQVVDSELSARYRAEGWWSEDSFVDALRLHALERPDDIAYVAGEQRLSWRQLEDGSTQVAAALISAGVEPGDRVAVWMPDGVAVHMTLLALEKVGATVVGIGARAGDRELLHLLRRTAATTLVTGPDNDEGRLAELAGAMAADGVVLRRVAVDLTEADGSARVLVDGAPVAPAVVDDDELDRRRIRPDDLFLINSTSGTTGLPKCVAHTQNRWRYFHHKATANGALSSDDVVLAAVPTPFGFGLWTSHVTPILLGARTVRMERFSVDEALATIEREQVTVLCCVSTQFIMMLPSSRFTQHNLSSLRVMFTGGEAVPYERAREFERATGATILQFYGSNETGLLSGTTLEDSPQRRLQTAGRIVPEMQVRLYEGGDDVTDSGRGQPACKGPATSIGYLDDDEANDELFTPEGWMLMGDICEIDDDGYLTVVGRTSDFIIRGGKNISAAQVESDVATHPLVAHVAVVAMPDAVFGERVCAYVELVEGASLSLAELLEHLTAAGVSKELFPEHLIVLDELPRSSGAKVAKGELREDIRRRVESEADAAGPNPAGANTPATNPPEANTPDATTGAQ